MKRDRGGEDSSDEQVYIRLSPRARLNNASSSSSSFRFPSLSLSLLKFEREREERKKKRGKTLKLRSGKERGSEAGYGSMFNKVWEGANRRDAIIRTTRQDMFLGRFNQFII